MSLRFPPVVLVARWRPKIPVALLIALALTLCLNGEVAPAPKEQYQWWLADLDLYRAQELSTGRGVVVAVIDSGVEASQPDLSGQVLPGIGIGNDAAPHGEHDSSAVGHGTAMAGIIAARGGGGAHILGIAPGARILPVSTGALADREEVAEGILWAVNNGARVINMSIGSHGPWAPELLDAVQYAVERDVVVVASSGNSDDGGDPSSLATLPGVLGAAGTDRENRVWKYSSIGAGIPISAPGVDMIVSIPREVGQGRNYDIVSGTSASAAVVSGVVALLRARFPRMTAGNIINRVLRTSRKVTYGDGQSIGLIDPVRALSADVPLVDGNPLVPPPCGPYPAWWDSRMTADYVIMTQAVCSFPAP